MGLEMKIDESTRLFFLVQPNKIYLTNLSSDGFIQWIMWQPLQLK